MKKEIVPGDNVSFKTSKYENEAIINWINRQSNVTDSIRYLIEQDITQYGVRNLQEYIPARRSVSTVRRTSAELPKFSHPVLQKPERATGTVNTPVIVKPEENSVHQQPSNEVTEKVSSSPEIDIKNENREPKDGTDETAVTKEDIDSWA